MPCSFLLYVCMCERIISLITSQELSLLKTWWLSVGWGRGGPNAGCLKAASEEPGENLQIIFQ